MICSFHNKPKPSEVFVLRDGDVSSVRHAVLLLITAGSQSETRTVAVTASILDIMLNIVHWHFNGFQWFAIGPH